MKIVVSIEGRMNSSRFPGKMIEDINGKSTLERVIERLKKVNLIDEIILATTVNQTDDILCDIALKNKIYFHRGSENNVYKRVCEAHEKINSDILVTICGDCPLLDYEIIEQYLAFFKKNNYDIIAFDKLHYYPQGIEFFIFSKEIFFEPLKTITDTAHKEHVGLYFLENDFNYNIFRIKIKYMFENLMILGFNLIMKKI